MGLFILLTDWLTGLTIRLTCGDKLALAPMKARKVLFVSRIHELLCSSPSVRPCTRWLFNLIQDTWFLRADACIAHPALIHMLDVLREKFSTFESWILNKFPIKHRTCGWRLWMGWVEIRFNLYLLKFPGNKCVKGYMLRIYHPRNSF